MPIIHAVFLSLHKVRLLGGIEYKFIGFRNFTRLVEDELLQPVTFFVVAIAVIGTFQLFDQSYIFSGGTGSPNNATLTLVLLIYQAVFRNLQMVFTLPALGIYAFFNRYFIQSVTFTGGKVNCQLSVVRR